MTLRTVLRELNATGCDYDLKEYTDRGLCLPGNANHTFVSFFCEYALLLQVTLFVTTVRGSDMMKLMDSLEFLMMYAFHLDCDGFNLE